MEPDFWVLAMACSVCLTLSKATSSTGSFRCLRSSPLVDASFVSVLVMGLGMIFENDDYKVVRIAQFYRRDDDSFGSEDKVYSLKSNSWRRIRDFPYYLPNKRADGLLASGALHWVVSRKPESDKTNLIAAFDLGADEYRPIAYSKSGGQVILEHDTKRLVWYDLEKKTIRNVKIPGMPDSLETDVCWGSLVSLCGDGEVVTRTKHKTNGRKRRLESREGFKLVL